MTEKKKVDWIRYESGQGDADLSNLKDEVAQEGLEEIETCRQAVEAAHARRDTAQEAEELMKLGEACATLAQMKSALEAYTRAQGLFHELQDIKKEADVHSRLATIFLVTGNAKNAYAEHLAALELYTQTEDYPGAAKELSNLANLNMFLKRPEEALNELKDALAIYRKLGDREHEANTLNSLGMILFEGKKVQDAIELFEQARRIAQEAGDKKQEISITSNLGTAYSMLGQLDRALEEYLSGLQVSRFIGDRQQEARLLMFIGQVYFRKRNLDSAIANTRAAVEKYETTTSFEIEKAREQLKNLNAARRSNSPVPTLIIVGVLLLVIIGFFAGTSIKNSIQQASYRKTAIAETQFPTKGGIEGMILNKNGTPLVDYSQAQMGWVVLVCMDPTAMGIECLTESTVDTAIDNLSTSLCTITNWDSQCMLHIGLGAREIGRDGSYHFSDVPPGEYQLVIIIYDSGIAMSIRTHTIDPVIVGQITRYDFVTK